MKWPDKPQELNLHQLEERLIALRIPFMQIRELPRGGQYSLRAIPEKNTWGGKTAGDIFFYGWSVRTFFKLYGSLVFDKF